MRFDRLYTKLFSRPVLLEPATRIGFELALLSLMHGGNMEQAAAQFSAAELDAGPSSFSARKAQPERAAKQADQLLEYRGQTALIHIDGSIDKNLSSWDRICLDATDLADVDKALATAGNDRSVRNVLLVIDSPGGSVTGVPETAARIAELAKKKNVFAFSEGLCCSAAYWLAASADQIFCTASAQMGSIGVYLALLDQSRRLDSMGLKIETVKDGKLKAAGAAWKTLTEDERAHFQDQVNQIGAAFRDGVNAKRPDVDEDTMQGQSFFGEENVNRGLADKMVSGLDEALAQF